METAPLCFGEHNIANFRSDCLQELDITKDSFIPWGPVNLWRNNGGIEIRHECDTDTVSSNGAEKWREKGWTVGSTSRMRGGERILERWGRHNIGEGLFVRHSLQFHSAFGHI